MHDIPAHGGTHAKFGYKRLHTNTPPTGNKYLSQALQPSPLMSSQCFPFCSQIIHHTESRKWSNIAATSQLMWICRSKVDGTNRNSCFVCLHVTPFQDTTWTTPEEMAVIYFISILTSSNKHKNKVKCGHLPSRQKNESNNSRYCDTYSEDTISNVQHWWPFLHLELLVRSNTQ